MQANTIKVCVFDFDGVIVESNDIKDSVFQKMFSAYPAHYADLMHYHREHVSESRVKKFDYLLNITGRAGDKQLMEQLLSNFSNLTLNLMKSVTFVNGAKELLASLKHLPLYLASITPITDLEIILQDLGLRHFFKDVYGCPPWTKLDAIKEIIKRENVGVEHVLLIGDSAGDQRCAKKTGIHFIGRNSGLPYDDPLPIAFNDLNEIREYMKEYAV
jgi:HAD superfamily hydrolase (TIGR01549 family)